MTKANMTPREKIAKARINLLTDYPFFGSIAMKLIPKELSEKEVELFGVRTIAVDMYGNLPYNPKWVEQQSDTVMKCALAHEVMHVSLNHLKRLGTRDQRLWNIAVDAAVNEILSHTFKIPDTWVRIPQMKQKCAEEIYDWLIKNAQLVSQMSGMGFDSHFFGSDDNASNSAQGQKGQQVPASPFYQPGQQPFDAARAVREAYNFAKTQGKLPAGIDRIFANILNPQLDWKEVLRRFIVQVIPHDFSYTRPSKRSIAAGFYMPMIKRESIELVIGVDSSGSISDEEYAEFLSEIYAMCKQFESLRAVVIVCDAAVQEVIEIDENFDPHCVHGRGYGGTDSQPVYDYIEENIGENKVKLLVYFSDGYINIPKREYAFHTLWIITKNGRIDEVSKQPNATVIQIPRNGSSEEDDY